MLEHIPDQLLDTRTFRYAVQQPDDQKFLHEHGLGPEEIRELLDLLRERRLLTSLEQYLDGPFRPRASTGYPSGRFSDGTIPVFYSALEPETAEAEAINLQVKYAIENASGRLANFMRVSCRFSGQTKDLRPYVSTMTYLTASSTSDYRQCRLLGSEAHHNGLDGLTTPSAQRSGGTCLPVFRRPVLSDPQEERAVIFSWDPATRAIQVMP